MPVHFTLRFKHGKGILQDVFHVLNEDHKQNGFFVCKNLQDQTENNKNYPCRVVKGDGSWVYGL
jgi:hypothetical protein